MSQSPKIVLGSPDAVLTVEDVYNVAHRLCTVELDPAACVETPSPKRSSSAAILPQCPVDAPEKSPENVERLQDVEVRATLVVLLHKLLRGQPRIRPFLPLFLKEILSLGVPVVIPVSSDDAAVIRAFIVNVYDIKRLIESVGDARPAAEAKEGAAEIARPCVGQTEHIAALSRLKGALEECKAGEIGVTRDEVSALESSFAGSIGIGALSFYSLNTFVGLADAVTALSFEALLANTEAFKPESLKQAFFQKSEADVVRDLNSLLFGSKLAKASNGGLDEDYIRNVPAIHGALRDAVSILASRLRVDINRVEVLYKKTNSLPVSTNPSVSGSYSCPSSLVTSTILPILVSLWPVVCSSFERTSKCDEFARIRSSEGEEQESKNDEENADKITALRAGLEAAAAMAAVTGDKNAVFLSRVTLSATETWRKMLVKETTASLALLSIRERASGGGGAQGQVVEKERASGPDSRSKAGATSVAPGRAAKIKKNFILGKGTDIMRCSLVNYRNSWSNEKPAGLKASNEGEALNVFFHPHTPELQLLLANVRNVLENSETRRLPKLAKGTRDFHPEQMVIREKAFGIISAVFKRHGAVAIDTPVFELKETLTGKYGEDSKLIYDLADQGGEILALRYDLTVPFARYLAINKVENLKRYHIARVYRRDNPAKGRYREFYQCDLDIAGRSLNPMVPDFEVLKVLTELLDELDVGEYEVKLNHRKLLDGMLHICGVPQTKFRSICSAIDKLDKLPWDRVRQEMIEEKGLAQDTADKIGDLVRQRGSPLALLEDLKQSDSPFSKDPSSVAALEELGVLFKYLNASKCIDRIVFDLSLARGLDYYTGVIFEAVFKGSTQVGSIAAGGRYDDLVGMFSGKQVPSVGVSLGIERVFAIMEKQEEDRKRVEQEDDRKRVVRSNETQVLLVVLGKDERWTEIAIEIVTDLWEGRLKAEFCCVAAAKLPQQITRAATAGIPWMVIVGEDEMKGGILRLKDISASKQEDIKRENLVAELQRRLGISEMAAVR